MARTRVPELIGAAFAPVRKEPSVGAPSVPEAADSPSVPESADAPIGEEPAQSVESAS
jgi:hypothetical protein